MWIKKSAQTQLFAMAQLQFSQNSFFQKLILGVIGKLQASALRLVNQKIYSGIPQGFILPD